MLKIPTRTSIESERAKIFPYVETLLTAENYRINTESPETSLQTPEKEPSGPPLTRHTISEDRTDDAESTIAARLRPLATHTLDHTSKETRDVNLQNLSLHQHREPTAESMFIRYTISEDRTGTTENLIAARLAGLGARSDRSPFARHFGGP